jgi:chromosome segregation ATPase
MSVRARDAFGLCATLLISIITDTELADLTAAERANSWALRKAPLSSTSAKTDPAYGKATDASGTTAAALSTVRADLGATQKARVALQNEVISLTSSLANSQKTNDARASQITALSKQKADMERKLRDRDEELRGKSRLVEQTQDEMVSLSLQVNMAEQRSERLEKENKDLIARWMKRMGEEAEKVNAGSGWQ